MKNIAAISLGASLKEKSLFPSEAKSYKNVWISLRNKVLQKCLNFPQEQSLTKMFEIPFRGKVLPYNVWMSLQEQSITKMFKFPSGAKSFQHVWMSLQGQSCTKMFEFPFRSKVLPKCLDFPLRAKLYQNVWIFLQEQSLTIMFECPFRSKVLPKCLNFKHFGKTFLLIREQNISSFRKSFCCPEKQTLTKVVSLCRNGRLYVQVTVRALCLWHFSLFFSFMLSLCFVCHFDSVWGLVWQ